MNVFYELLNLTKYLRKQKIAKEKAGEEQVALSEVKGKISVLDEVISKLKIIDGEDLTEESLQNAIRYQKELIEKDIQLKAVLGIINDDYEKIREDKILVLSKSEDNKKIQEKKERTEQKISEYRQELKQELDKLDSEEQTSILNFESLNEYKNKIKECEEEIKKLREDADKESNAYKLEIEKYDEEVKKLKNH